MVCIMRSFILFLLLTLSPLLWAKDQPWQDAQVIRGTAAIPQRGQYWLRGLNTTYVIRNYSNGTIVGWWVRLTLGGSAKVYSDGKNLHIIDNLGKERKCQILQEMINATADEFLAKEAAKTPEQLLKEKEQRDAVELQRQALFLQQQRDLAAQAEKTKKVEVEVKDCNANPALCIN